MTKVIAGPWVGEFGWELFCWQAYLRAIKNQFDIEDMVAVTRPGRELLYEDFCKVETTEIPVKNADSWHNARVISAELRPYFCSARSGVPQRILSSFASRQG